MVLVAGVTGLVRSEATEKQSLLMPIASPASDGVRARVNTFKNAGF